MCAENLLKKADTEYEFVLGKDSGKGVHFVRNSGCDTEQEIEKTYKAWLIQSDGNSETCLPYKKMDGNLYIPLHDIVYEAEDELAKKTQGQGKKYVM